MATTMEVARKLVELCKKGENLQAVEQLYSPDIVSVETHSMPGFPQKTEGIEAVRGKNKWWLDNHEVHSGVVKGPWPHGDRFIVNFEYDVTPKAGPMAGKRMQMVEAALYTVQGGKITQEEFFYDMGT